MTIFEISYENYPSKDMSMSFLKFEPFINLEIRKIFGQFDSS